MRLNMAPTCLKLDSLSDHKHPRHLNGLCAHYSEYGTSETVNCPRPKGGHAGASDADKELVAPT